MGEIERSEVGCDGYGSVMWGGGGDEAQGLY